MNIKQISLIDSGLFIEYETPQGIESLCCNRAQTDEILGMHVKFQDNPPLFTPKEISIEQVEAAKKMVLQGYPVREYKTRSDGFYHKITEAVIHIEPNMVLDDFKSILLRLNIFGVFSYVLKGDLQNPNLEEIVSFLHGAGRFISVFCDSTVVIESLSFQVCRKIGAVIFDMTQVSTAHILKILPFLTQNNISCGLINYDGDNSFFETHGIIDLSSQDRFCDKCSIHLSQNKVEYFCLDKSKEFVYTKDFSIVKSWVEFIQGFIQGFVKEE